MFQNKKLLILAIVLIVILLVAAAFVLGLFGKRSDRSLTLYRVEGQGEIERAGEGALPAEEGAALRSGDRVSVGEDGSLYLKMDGNKYVLADAGTRFTLEAAGTSKDSSTLLTLEKGTLMLHVMSALSAKSSFAVETPDAKFEVRGTSFRVDASDGGAQLYVFDGKVTVTPRSGEAQTFTRGQYVTLRGGAIGRVQDEIDYDSMSLESLSFLTLATEKGKILSVSAAELQEIIAHNGGQLIVKFMVGEEVFGTQTVAYGEHAHAPKFLPAEHGNWNFDFSTPITKDIEIVWVE